MSIGTKKIIGVFVLFIVVSGLTAVFSPFFLDVYNVENLLRRSALFGIISIGAAFVIMTGGIDLSIGSVVALTACLVPWMLVDQDISPWIAIPFAIVISLCITLNTTCELTNWLNLLWLIFIVPWIFVIGLKLIEEVRACTNFNSNLH